MNIKFEATTLADHVRVECTGIFQQDEILQLFERVFEQE